MKNAKNNNLKNPLSLINFSVINSLDGNTEVFQPSDIFYIGRGQYWIRKKGLAVLGETE